MRAIISELAEPESGNSIRKEISFRNVIFKSGAYAYWKTIISDESKAVKKDSLELVRIKEIELPPKSTVSPLSIFRHASGTTIDVLTGEIRKIEEVRRIRYAYFYAVENGEIEEGDIIGVIKVYPINVGSPEEVEYIKPPEGKPIISNVNGNLVYRKNGGVFRKHVKVEEPWYSRWHIGEWRMLISDQDLELKSGEGVMVKIKPLEIPRNTIPVPLYGYRHPDGVVIDIYSPGMPRKIEDKKIITGAYFLPVNDTEIRKGDVIGVINLYAVAVGGLVDRVIPYLGSKTSGNIVIKKKESLERIEFEHIPFVFRRSGIGYLKPIICAETTRIKANKPKKVLVEKIDVPSGSIIQPMGGRGHSFGITIDVEFEKQKMVEEDRVIDSAIVLSHYDGEILRGDIIGVLMQYQITPLTSPELFVRRYG